ncbi:MAG: hypothetical protein IH974_10950 [Myxococcales bacterium]|nr:hypothetical protein [Myxococcales bacterium]
MSNALTSKQIKAAGLLASGKTAVEVAKSIGVTPETISHWKNYNPNFQALLNRFNEEAVDATIRAMRDLGSKAIARLGDLVENGSEKTGLEAVRLVFENIEKNTPRGSTDPGQIELSIISKHLLTSAVREKNHDEIVQDWVSSDPIGDPFDGADEDEDEDEEEAA